MLLQTPLRSRHEAAGATFTPFAGYDMPVHYGSIKQEHLAVRTGVGLFDVSHMSNLWVRGPHAAAALARVTPTDPSAVPPGKGKYTVFLHDDGTILDDAFYFHMPDGQFFVIPNAGMNEAVAAHIVRHDPKAEVEDVSRQWAILALQGPRARGVLDDASEGEPPRFHHIHPMSIAGVECLVSGTGYTGEKGVEVYLPAAGAGKVWDALMAAGGSAGIRPIGLGARDTLRLEKGYCLAGHEFKGGRTPLEAGLEWTMAWDGDFVGKARLLRQRDEPHPRLAGLVVQQGVPREGHPVLRDGRQVGVVTSGTMSPSLGKGIALAYLDAGASGPGLAVGIRGRAAAAEVAPLPFV